ncbi:MAG: type II toxin-antitoxin system VapC family toxin [Thermomicrobiales bacterium]|nr:type II toxin-antitoxin system VapC family toxin [Thermomicrobiales bacterium]
MPTISTTYCVDASVVGRIITGSGGPNFDRLLARWQDDPVHLIAPSLLGYEVANTLHKKRKQGLSGNQAALALSLMVKLNIEIVQDMQLHSSAVAVARELNLPAAYDAHYLALSLARGARFLTSDLRLFNTVSHRYDWLEYIQSQD